MIATFTKCCLMLGVLLTGSAVGAASPWEGRPFECLVVPALSSNMRLPDTLPEDGQAGDELRVIASRGEYEPASFVIVPRQAVGKLTFRAGDLKGPDGSTLPASRVDIKIVKCWYQGGTAWYSYFSDNNRRELVPELLLNDETLIRVDHATKNNELHIGDKYASVSYPMSEATDYFNYLTEPVADARTLQPIALSPGENKQVWVTLHVPPGTPAGLYQGKIDIAADGKPAGAMRVALRVLPLDLPSPRTYYSLDNDYLVTLYSTNVLDLARVMKVDKQWAIQQQKAIYRNLLAHNVVNIRADSRLAQRDKDREQAIAEMREEIELLREAGATLKPLLSSEFLWPASKLESDNPKLLQERIEAAVRTLKEAVGHSDIYITSWDEAGVDRTKTFRVLTEHLNSLGVKLWVTTAKDRHFNLAGYGIGYANHAGWPTRENAATWHAIGAKVASYAGPHTGPENPDTFRRWEGLARYKANYDGSFNYKYYSQLHPLESLRKRQKPNTWNDFSFDIFRAFNLVYPTHDGVVDTIAWEGFREGIDDVRYATLLKQEADRAIKSGDAHAAQTALKALVWLELADAATADLDTMRQEMIEKILTIQQAMKKD